MKTLAVVILFSVSILALIIALDMINHVSWKDAYYNAINPFRVNDIPEYLIIWCIVFYYFLKEIKLFQKK